MGRNTVQGKLGAGVLPEDSTWADGAEPHVLWRSCPSVRFCDFLPRCLKQTGGPLRRASCVRRGKGSSCWLVAGSGKLGTGQQVELWGQESSRLQAQ